MNDNELPGMGPAAVSSPPGGGSGQSAYERCMSSVHRAGLRVSKQHGHDAMVECPGHDDKTESLHITDDSANGRALLYCFAGCDTDSILSALGLQRTDLYDEPLPAKQPGERSKSRAQRTGGHRRGKLGPLPKPVTIEDERFEDEPTHEWITVAEYGYEDADGQVVQVVERQECSSHGKKHKNFPQKYLGSSGRWYTQKSRAQGFVSPIYYHLPALLAGLQEQRTVYLVEGEKDVESVEQAGQVATTVAGGAGNAQPVELDVFAGADVVVCLDRDKGGYTRGIRLFPELSKVAGRVRLMIPATTDAKSDVTDHLEAGFGLEDLIQVQVEELEAWVEVLGAHEDLDSPRRGLRLAVTESLRRNEMAGEEAKDKFRDQHQAACVRWAYESQRLAESIFEHRKRVLATAQEPWSTWMTAAVEQITEIWDTAWRLSRTAHEVAQIAVPPLLQDKHPAVTAAVDEERPAQAEAAPVDPVTGEPDQGGFSVKVSRPIFKIIDQELLMWSPAARRSQDPDPDKIDPITGKEGEWKLLLSMAVRVVAKEYQEPADAQSTTTMVLQGRSLPPIAHTESLPILRAYRIEYTHPATSEIVQIRVPVEEWEDATWLTRLPGDPEYDHKKAGLDLLKRAILAVSTDMKTEILYRSVGWRTDSSNPEGPRWIYVHAGGAISKDGVLAAPVGLTGPLARYNLPDPTMDSFTLVQTWQDHLQLMIEEFPDRVMFPLFGHLFRSVCRPAVMGSMMLVGDKSSGKTSLGQKAMHVFGELWERNTPGASATEDGATSNALRIILSQVEDGTVWIDDFCPDPSWGAAQTKVEKLGRMIYNGIARDRSSRDGQELVSGNAPHAAGLFTSEVMPRVTSSGGTRVFALPVAASDLPREALFPLDNSESRHGRALFMASFLQWLAGEMDTRREVYQDLADVKALEYRSFHDATDREAEMLGNAYAGWQAVVDFMVAREVMSAEAAAMFMARAQQALLDALQANRDPDLPGTTGAKIRQLLAHAMRQQLVYCEDVDTGGVPEWPLAHQLGWIREGEDKPEGSFGGPRYLHGRVPLGYVRTNPNAHQRREILCTGSQLEQALKLATESLGEKLELDISTVARALSDEGTLFVSGCDGRMTVFRDVPAAGIRRQRFYAVSLNAILNIDEGNDDGDHPAELPDPDPAPTLDSLPQHPEIVSPACDDHCSADNQSAPDSATNREQDDQMATAVVTDADGVAGVMRNCAPGEEKACPACGRTCTAPVGEEGLHFKCWKLSTAAERAVFRSTASQPMPQPVAAPVAVPATAGAVTTVAAPAPAPVAPVAAPATAGAVTTVAAPAPAPVAPVAAPATATVVPASASNQAPLLAPLFPSEFSAAAAVVDVDGIWCSSGERLELPEIQHLGDLVELGLDLKLGTKTTKWGGTQPGQIWIADGLARQLGIPVDQIREARYDRRNTVAQEATEGLPVVVDAIEAGYRFGIEGKEAHLNRFLRGWHKDRDTRDQRVLLVLCAALHGARQDDDDFKILQGDPDAATLAHRLGLMDHHLGYPLAFTPATTAIDLLRTMRAKDRERMLAPVKPVPPAQIAPLESDLLWCRCATPEELAMGYLHSYDRSGSYLPAMSGLELGIGQAEHFAGAQIPVFKSNMPGYFRLRSGQVSPDWRLPSLLNNERGADQGEVWVTTPTLQLAMEHDYEPEILEAWIWPEHTRVLQPFYERVRDARTSLLASTDPEAVFAVSQIKQIYAALIGKMGSVAWMNRAEQNGAMPVGFAPERRHMVIAKARANVLRRVIAIGNMSNQWPVAIDKDSIIYASNEPDPIKAWPGDPKWFGTHLGGYKAEVSCKFTDEHKKMLVGGRWHGKQLMHQAAEAGEE